MKLQENYAHMILGLMDHNQAFVYYYVWKMHLGLDFYEWNK